MVDIHMCLGSHASVLCFSTHAAWLLMSCWLISNEKQLQLLWAINYTNKNHLKICVVDFINICGYRQTRRGLFLWCFQLNGCCFCVAKQSFYLLLWLSKSNQDSLFLSESSGSVSVRLQFLYINFHLQHVILQCFGMAFSEKQLTLNKYKMCCKFLISVWPPVSLGRQARRENLVPGGARCR